MEEAGGSWSVGAVHDHARAAAARLAGGGVRPGDVVGTALRGADAAVALFAVELAGAVELPVSSRLPADRIAAALRSAGCRLLLTDAATFAGSPGMQEVAGRVLVVLLDPGPDGPAGLRTLADWPAAPLPRDEPDPLGPSPSTTSTSGTPPSYRPS